MLLVLTPGGSARANGIYLNGVKVNGLTNQNFEGCKVTFDAMGNVFITAPGFQVKAIPQSGTQPTPLPPTISTPAPTPPPAAYQPAPQPAAVKPATPPTSPPPAAIASPKPDAQAAVPSAPLPSGPLTRQYYLVTVANPPGGAQYDVDVYVNGKWVRKIRNRDRQTNVVNITQHLQWGRNVVNFAATKNLDGQPRRSSSDSEFIRLIIGPGIQGGGTVELLENLAEFRVSANRMDNHGAQYVIEIK